MPNLSDPFVDKHIEIARETRTCEQHGCYEAIKWELQPKHPAAPAFWGNCPQCNDIYQKEQDERDASRDVASLRQRLVAQWLKKSNIPPRYAESTIWNWQHGMDRQRRIWDWARSYCSQFDLVLQTGRCGILLGAPGTGKTHLGCGILRHVLEKGGTGLYTTALDMIARIRASYDKNTLESEDLCIVELTTVEMLVIDEVGQQLATEHESRQFFRIIDARYGRLMPTILVSNLNKTDLCKLLGDSVIDRFKESGGAILIFDWDSQRQRGAP